VTVGNATQPFLRLLEAIDQFAGNKLFPNGEKVFVQSGHNPGFHPRHSGHRRFLSIEEFELYMKESTLVICHGGCGTLLQAIRLGKVPVVVPRRKKYGEHVNDHQLQLSQVLANEGRVVLSKDIEKLPTAISEARHRQAQPFSTAPPQILSLVSNALEKLVAQS